MHTEIWIQTYSPPTARHQCVRHSRLSVAHTADAPDADRSSCSCLALCRNTLRSLEIWTLTSLCVPGSSTVPAFAWSTAKSTSSSFARTFTWPPLTVSATSRAHSSIGATKRGLIESCFLSASPSLTHSLTHSLSLQFVKSS